jgi:glyoxylase-like metal-dependent hydrolase (beta-lactamase superfamily II)
MLDLRALSVGEFESNCYLLSDPGTGDALLIDPGAEPKRILDWLGDVGIQRILITHGHSDHVGALEAIRDEFDIEVGIHPLDVDEFGLKADFALATGDRVPIGASKLEIVHIPGHTPGSVGLRILEDGGSLRALVGDAVFPGGPGHTQTPEDLETLLQALETTVFTWPDETEIFPGHGESTTVGTERPAFESFIKSSRKLGLCGDVTWES